MNTLIKADMYRLRKGASLRNTFIAMAGIVIFLLFILWVGGFVSVGPTIVPDSLEEFAYDLTEKSAEEMRQGGVGVTATSAVISSGVDFVREVLSQNILAFLLLPIFITVFADDFNSGAYRNLLTYDTNRGRIYLTKLLLSFILSMALLVFSVVVSALFGGFVFGFGGMFSLQFLSQTLLSIIFMAPLYFALVAFGHMAVAITKKSGTAIAVYFVAVLVYSALIMTVAGLLPGFEWLTLLDFLSGISYLAYYWVIPAWEIGTYALLGLGVGAVCTLAGLRSFKKADLN